MTKRLAKQILKEYRRVQRSDWKAMPLTEKAKKMIAVAKYAL